MNVNTSLVTDTSKAVTENSVDAYRDKISDHIDSDFSAHTSIQLYESTLFYEQAPANAEYVSGAGTLRMLLTSFGTNTQAYALPVLVQAGSFPPAGSAPVILRQPASTTAVVGSNVTFTVYVASSTPGFYQWQKNSIDIAGANSADYTIGNVQLSDANDYRVVITNAVGQTTSATATLTVTTT